MKIFLSMIWTKNGIPGLKDPQEGKFIMEVVEKHQLSIENSKNENSMKQRTEDEDMSSLSDHIDYENCND